jgi:hypothetical protein
MARHPQSRSFRKQSKRAEYERLSSLPASREEVLEALCFYVDFEARTFPSHLAAQVKNMGTKPEDCTPLTAAFLRSSE